MKTYKDLIFAIILIVWLTSDILSFIFYGSNGIGFSNIIFIGLFSILVLVKCNTKFGLWLETDLKNLKK